MSAGVEVAVIIAVTGMLLLAGMSVGAVQWRKRRLAALEAGSCIALTSHGPIEHAQTGQGSVILYFHGTLNGFDQGLILHSFLRGESEETDFTVLSPSRPGYLRTPLASGRTFDEQADALAALLDHLGINKVAVLGASGGGAAALQFVLRHPQRAQSLVLFCALTRRSPPRRQGGIRRRLLSRPAGWFLLDLLSAGIYLMLRFRTRALARRVFGRMTAQGVRSAEVRDRVARMMTCPHQVRIFQGILAGMLPISLRLVGALNDQEQLALLPEYPLEQIRVPTLVLHGREDAVAGFDQAEFVTNKVPGAELHAVEGGGHFLWVGEHVPQMRTAMIEFLRKHAG